MEKNESQESKNQINKVLETVNDIETVLNSTLIPNFMKLHNIDPKYGIIQMKQELVASDAAFFNKKIYGLYITNKEKKPVDELEVKGMIIRKSNFAEYSRLKIEELLKLILCSDELSLDDINEFIDTSRKEALNLCSEGSIRIAGAVSYNKEMSQYKSVPSHVKAMELWNSLEYSYFVPGTKGFLFRIKGIDTMKAPKRIIDNIGKMGFKNKSIVIPFEQEKLPEYYVLNVVDQMEYSWESRIREIMSVFYDMDTTSMESLMEDEYLSEGTWDLENGLEIEYEDFDDE